MGVLRAVLVLLACSVLGLLADVRTFDEAEGFGLYPLGLVAVALAQVEGRVRTAVGVVAGVATAGTLLHLGLSPAAAVLYAAAAVVAAHAAIRVMRGPNGDFRIRHEKDFIRVIGAATVGGAVVAAAAAIASVADNSDNLGPLVLTGFIHQIASMLVWLPLVMRSQLPAALAQVPERILQWVVVIVTSVAVFSSSGGPSFAYVVLVILCWAGLRLSLVETLIQLIVVRLISTSFVSHDRGPFSEAAHGIDLHPEFQWLFVQLFLACSSIAVVALGLSSARSRRDTRREALERADRVAASKLSTVFEALQAERHALEEMREVDKVKDALVSTVSHELRTPITNIIGYAEMLDDGDYGSLSGEQSGALGRIADNGRRLLALIDDLLTLSRMRAAQLEITRATIDLVQVIRVAEQAILPRLRGAGVSLEIDLPDTPLIIQGEAEKLERVMVNLMSSAVKFTPRMGQVTVRLLAEGSWAIIEVRDTGYGIPREELDRLFSQFFRSSVAQQKHIQGTGLGLSIVRSIVEGHGGQIEVNSEVDVGTVFWVYLPR